MISVRSSGSFQQTTAALTRMTSDSIYSSLDRHGAAGVAALSAATPVESSETANSWSYKVTKKPGRVSIGWFNSHVENDVPIAVLIQYGHATRNGGYVEGRDFINPAIQPIFDQIADDVWKEVTR